MSRIPYVVRPRSALMEVQDCPSSDCKTGHLVLSPATFSWIYVFKLDLLAVPILNNGNKKHLTHEGMNVKQVPLHLLNER